jgi:flagellar basal body-associated protein FliL
VFALFWILIVVLLELFALGLLFIFYYALTGAAGAGELIPEYDYADGFVAEDYQTPDSRPTNFENILDIAI